PAPLEQGEHLDDVDAARERRHGVAVCGEEPVRLLQREDGADLGGFLPLARREDAERTLAGEVDGLAVDPSAERHEAVQGAQLIGVQSELVVAGVAQAAVRRQLLPRRRDAAWLPGSLGRGRPWTGGHTD